MQHEPPTVAQPSGASYEAFLNSFSHAPDGLEPAEVFNAFVRMSGYVRQLEEQAKQVSAPQLLEAALREAAEERARAAEAAERTYAFAPVIAAVSPPMPEPVAVGATSGPSPFGLEL